MQPYPTVQPAQLDINQVLEVVFKLGMAAFVLSTFGLWMYRSMRAMWGQPEERRRR